MLQFAKDAADPASAFDPAKAATISITSKAGLTEAFAEGFSAVQWQPARLQPEIIRRLGEILRGRP
jgi:hypothetical protein